MKFFSKNKKRFSTVLLFVALTCGAWGGSDLGDCDKPAAGGGCGTYNLGDKRSCDYKDGSGKGQLGYCVCTSAPPLKLWQCFKSPMPKTQASQQVQSTQDQAT